ncbi:MAG: sodium/glutamate symporter [Rhodospirillales bacterium]
MLTISLDPFETATLAICVFFVGKAIVMRSRVLQTYSIPEPVIGGFTCAIATTILFLLVDVDVSFDISRRDVFLIYFFAALGLRSDFKELLTGWRPLITLLALASAFLFLQNGVGIALASAFDLHPKLGIVAGSMALTGRAGTTVAWSGFFDEHFGLSTTRVGIATNMVGLIAACCIGGPIAKLLIRLHKVQTPGPSANLDVGISFRVPPPPLDYNGFLFALLRLHLAVILGQLISLVLKHLGIEMPLYVLGLAAGIVLGNALPRIVPKFNWPGSNEGLALISDVSLGLFYTMTLMSMRLWAIEGIATFIITVIMCQVVLATLYTIFVIFPIMGRDYQAVVISTGFVGVSLGSTATTMALMTAVANVYGRAHLAFVIVPIVCGFFIDIANFLVISLFAAW